MTVPQPPRQDTSLPRYNPASPPTEERESFVFCSVKSEIELLTMSLAVDYVDLAIIDLSKLSTEAGKAELVVQARDAMKHQGFMYVVNHGFTIDQVR